MCHPEDSEEELLRQWRASRCEEDRRRLLERILSPYLSRISSWAMRMRGNQADAAELAQDALLAVCANIDRFRGECRFSTWVYTILRNQAFRRHRKAVERPEISLDEIAETRSDAADPEQSLELQRQGREIRHLLDTELTPLEAKIFLLHYADDVPLTVLDRRLGLTNRSGAKAYLVSARRKLGRRMNRIRIALGLSPSAAGARHDGGPVQ